MLVFCLMLLSWIAADLLWWWLADRRLRCFATRRPGRFLLGAFMSGQTGYMLHLLARALADGLPDMFPMSWEVAAYVWHLVILPAALLGALSKTGVCSVLRMSGRSTRRAPASNCGQVGRGSDGNPAATCGQVSRRQLLSAAAAALPPVAAMGLTGWSVAELGDFRVRRCELALPSLPPDLDGLTIAHVTDLHIGRFLPYGMIGRVADATNALSADLVAFTGDLNDVSAKNTHDGIDFISRLAPRHGLVMIEGNHDVMTDAERFEEPIRDAGLPLLLDAASTFFIAGRSTPVQFLGISWGDPKRGQEIGRTGKDARKLFRVNSAEATKSSIERVLSLRSPEAFPILLAHHPHAFDPAAAAGLPLVLSGHTHGGQIMLTRNIGAGPMRFKYWTGLYSKGNSRLFIANGVGNWFPLRLNAPAEIVHLTLRKI